MSDPRKEHPWRRAGDDLLLHIDNRIEGLRNELMCKLDKVDDKTQDHDAKLKNGIEARLERIDTDLQKQGEKLDQLADKVSDAITLKTLIGLGATAAAIASAMFGLLTFIVRVL